MCPEAKVQYWIYSTCILLNIRTMNWGQFDVVRAKNQDWILTFWKSVNWNGSLLHQRSIKFTEEWKDNKRNGIAFVINGAKVFMNNHWKKMIELSQLSSSQINEYYTIVIKTYGIITDSAKYWEIATFCQHIITNISLVWKFSWYSPNYYFCLFCHIITLLAHTQFAINYYCKIIYTSIFNWTIWLLLLKRRTLHLSFLHQLHPALICSEPSG